MTKVNKSILLILYVIYIIKKKGTIKFTEFKVEVKKTITKNKTNKQINNGCLICKRFNH